jgi:hypothetical protein
MQTREAVVKEIRENWFNNHVAKFTEHPDGSKILEWRHKDGSGIYAFTAILYRGRFASLGISVRQSIAGIRMSKAGNFSQTWILITSPGSAVRARLVVGTMLGTAVGFWGLWPTIFVT